MRRVNNALAFLKGCNSRLTPQQYKTVRGQILAGDVEGGLRGLQNILETRRQDHEHPTRQDPGHRPGQ